VSWLVAHGFLRFLLTGRHRLWLSFTCVEMRDCEHPPEGRCSPEALLQHIIDQAEQYGVPLAGENALQR
jgi:beta-amylase